MADDETVKRLNAEYRGLDQTTDVLAFSFEHEGEYMGDVSPPASPDGFDFILPPREEGVAGGGDNLLPAGGQAGGTVGPRCRTTS